MERKRTVIANDRHLFSRKINKYSQNMLSKIDCTYEYENGECTIIKASF